MGTPSTHNGPRSPTDLRCRCSEKTHRAGYLPGSRSISSRSSAVRSIVVAADFPRAGAISWCLGWERSMALREQPRERDLRRCRVLSCSERSQPGTMWNLLSRSARTRKKVAESDASNAVFSSILPVRKPLPRGLNGTNPIPIPRARATLRLRFPPPHEYSLCRAVTGCPRGHDEWLETPASDRPKC